MPKPQGFPREARRSSLKLYGERNSGTRYLQHLVAANLRVRCLRGTTPNWFDTPFLGAEWSRDLYFRLTFRRNLGWKHMQVPELLPASPGTLIVCLTKHPCAWLVSMFRRPHHARRRFVHFDDFLRTPWPTLAREHASPELASPMALWNAKHASYLRLHETQGAVLLPYETLVRAPFEVLTKLGQDHAIPALREPFVNIERSTHADSPQRDYAYLRDYYAEERWRGEISPQQLALIERSLDAGLLQRLGYVLAPARPQRDDDA